MSELIDVKTAIKTAKDFAESIYEDSITNVSVEEVELSKTEESWIITLGWTDLSINPPNLTPVEIAAGIRKTRPKTYKTFYIDAKNGETWKMKDF